MRRRIGLELTTQGAEVTQVPLTHLKLAPIPVLEGHGCEDGVGDGDEDGDEGGVGEGVGVGDRQEQEELHMPIVREHTERTSQHTDVDKRTLIQDEGTSNPNANRIHLNHKQ